MNKNILYALMAGASAIGLASCDENSWNDHFLDGFEEGVEYNDSPKGTYAITADDYSAIEKLLQKEATTNEEKKAAKAIGTNLYFNKASVYPASYALLPFLNTSSFPYYLGDNGTVVDITFNEASTAPAELAVIASAKKYTVSSADYKAAWESDEDYINGFAPMLSASKQLPKILKANITDANSDSYAVVTYNESATNPVFNVSADAPDVFLDAPFAEGDDGGFSIENVKLPEGSTYVWKHSSYNGDFYMRASGYVKGRKESEAWLISPEVKLSGNTALTFDQAWNRFKSIDNAKQEATVWVREKNGQWSQLTPLNFPENASFDFYPSGEIDLAAYNGKTIQIGFLYKSSTESAGTWDIKNVKIQPATSVRSSRSLAAEVPTETKNAVYYFNGTDWDVAEGIAVLNPADYTAMGASNNNLGEPEIYIPLYLKNKFPYAQSGTQKYVVYNGTKTDLFVYDGSNWSLNNIGLEEVVGRFEKKNGEWKFVKYIGKAIFDLFEEQAIQLERSYLIVAEGACALPIKKGSTYGYPEVTKVSFSGTQIVEPTDANAFFFTKTFEKDGKVITAPEGKFIIRDTNGRYLFMGGPTRQNINVSNEPLITDNAIAETYLWTATNNGNGTWSLVNHSDNLVRTWMYSIGHTSYGVYKESAADRVLPALYILNE